MKKIISKLLQTLMIITLTINPIGMTPVYGIVETNYELHFSTDASINNGVGNGNYEFHFLNELDATWYSQWNIARGGDANALAAAYGVTPEIVSGQVFNGFIVDVIEYHQDTDLIFIGVRAVFIPNSAPVAIGDSYTSAEDAVLTIPATGVLINDSDVNNNSLTAILVSGVTASQGSVVLNADGSFVYTPTSNFNGSATFTYKANDGYADSNVVTVTITVTPQNDGPTAIDDNATGFEDQPIIISTVDLLTNDTDIDGLVLSVTDVGSATHGSVALDTGIVTFTPDAHYYGVAQYTYNISDGAGGTSQAVVHLNIAPINDAPTADADSFSADEDTAIVFPAASLVTNDDDIDGDALVFDAYVASINPLLGTLVLNAGTFTFTPVANWNGSVTFTYNNSDGALDSNPATVTLTINPVNDGPIANNDTGTTDEDAALVIPATSLLINDTDLDGGALSVTSVSDAFHGTVGLDAGSITFTPTANYNGTAQFTYYISDGAGGTSSATVNILVNSINDAPVGNDDEYTTNEDTPLVVPAVGVLSNDTDVDFDTLNVVSHTNPSHGSLVLNPDGSFVYTPDANYAGDDSFTYTITDNHGLGDTLINVVLHVVVINDKPTATPQIVTTPEDSPLAITLAGTDVENAVLSFTIGTLPTHGLLAGSGASWTYTPAANYHGPDFFTFTSSDGSLSSEEATVSITVTPVNDLPIANPQSVTTAEDTAKVITLTGSDQEDLILTDFDVISIPEHGALSGSGSSLTYTPALNYVGPDSFDFTVTDSELGTSTLATITITVTAENDVPVAVADAYSTPEDTPLNVLDIDGLLINDSDVDEDEFGVYEYTQPTNGLVTVLPDGSFTYSPNLNFVGVDTFTYTLMDENETVSQPATITITVSAVNDAPTAVGQELTTPEDTPLAIILTGADVDEDVITFAIATGPTSGTLSSTTGSAITYTPALNFVGTDSFTFTTSDGTLESAPTTILITVTAINDVPVATPLAFTVANAGTFIGTLAGTDVEGSALTFAISAAPVNGSLTLVGSGFTYIHNGTATLADSFSFTVSDGEITSPAALGTITVLAAPTPPAPTPTPTPTPTPPPIIIPPAITPLAALNTAPIALAGSTGTQFESAVNGNAQATDADGDDLTYELIDTVENGLLIFNEDGSFTYTPNVGFTGTDSFSFIANDGTTDSNVATYIISVEEAIVIEAPETPLAALPAAIDLSWLYWLAGLLAAFMNFLAFLRPNIKYRLIQKDGSMKTLRRRIARPDGDILFVELNDKGLEDIVDIDVLMYKRLAKHLGNITVSFMLRNRVVQTVTIPESQDENYTTLIHL